MQNNIFNVNNIDKTNIFVKNNYCFILIDTETCNGFDRKDNAIIQLAFKFLGTNYIFNSYCKPDESISWMINNKNFISKIKKEDVINSPELKDVLLSFKDVIYCIKDITPIFVAHNSSFDRDMLNLCLKYYNMDLGYVKWCNTMNKLFFNIKDENNKNIRSLENITKYLFKDLYINFHDAKNDVENLNNCLLKIHKNNDKIISIIMNIVEAKNKEEDSFLLEYKNILDNFNEFCNLNVTHINVNNSDYINLYKDILEKEKEITKYKNTIKSKIIKLLEHNNNYLDTDNKEIFLNEYNMKQLDSKMIKDSYPDVYYKCVKNIKYKKIIMKEKDVLN